MSSVPSVILNDGTKIPQVGYGAGTANNGKECTQNVLSALKTGYTYIDRAQQYLGTDGKDVDPREVLDTLLEELGLDYVDCYLVHNPYFAKPNGLVGTWKILEKLREEGKTRSIGVSNFREEDLMEMQDHWSVPPAVNQIEYNPYVSHAPNVQRLAALCAKHNIKIQAYAPLASLFRSPNGPIDETVNKIAEAKGCTAGQVLLRWAAEKTGGVIVTTSRQVERQKEQLEAFTTVSPLSSEQVEEIAKKGTERFYRHFQNPVWAAAKA